MQPHRRVVNKTWHSRKENRENYTLVIREYSWLAKHAIKQAL
jgi:hypothetical protein